MLNFHDIINICIWVYNNGLYSLNSLKIYLYSNIESLCVCYSIHPGTVPNFEGGWKMEPD